MGTLPAPDDTTRRTAEKLTAAVASGPATCWQLATVMRCPPHTLDGALSLLLADGTVALAGVVDGEATYQLAPA